MTGTGEIEPESGTERTAVPARPIIHEHEKLAWPTPLVYGKQTIGWQYLPDKKGGPSFVTVRRTSLGDWKVISRYPLTDEGWAAAWHELVRLDEAVSEKARAEVERRVTKDRATVRRRQLDTDSLAYLPEIVFLGGYFPDVDLVPGKTYDVRFLADRLALLPCFGLQALGELPYRDIRQVDIGGPGLIKSGGGFVGGGFGAVAAVEGMALAAILNAVTTRTKIKTVLQVQAASAELFLLHAATEPEALRIELSRAIGAVREAQATQTVPLQPGDSSGAASVVSELIKLASMLESGLLTREEFDRLKGMLIEGL